MEKQEKIDPPPNPCLNCPDPKSTLLISDDIKIGVGFGTAMLTKNNEVVFSENGEDWNDLMSTKSAEDIAAKDPDQDWRITLNGPMHGEEYQRQGGEWVLIGKNEGFV